MSVRLLATDTGPSVSRILGHKMIVVIVLQSTRRLGRQGRIVDGICLYIGSDFLHMALCYVIVLVYMGNKQQHY